MTVEVRSLQRRRIGGSGTSLPGGTAWLLAPPLGYLLLFMVAPFVAVCVAAISEKGVVGSLAVAGDELFLEAVWRTVVLAVVVTAVCLALAVCYSIAMAVASRRGRAVLLVLLFATFWVSLLVRTFGWVVLFQPRGVLYDVLSALGLVSGPLDLLQTSVAMYPAMVHIMLPYMVLPIYASVMSIDPKHIAAARGMGASAGLVLRKVVLPQLIPGCIAGSTLVFTLSLGFFVTPALLGGPSNLTVGTLIQREFGSQYDLGSAAAMGALLLIAVMVLLFIANRGFGVTKYWKMGA